MFLIGFIFGAYVNARGNYIRNAEPTLTNDDEYIDRLFFSSELKMSFDVHLPGSVYLHSLLSFQDNYLTENDGFELEEAFVAFDPQDWLATKLGRFRRWFGWERFDAPDLWRISNSYTHYNTGSMDGIGIYFSPETAFTSGIFVVDEIVTPDEPAPTKGGGDLGYGVTFRVSTAPNNLYKLDAFLDVNTAQSLTEADGASNVFGVSFNGSHDNIMESPLSAGFDIGSSLNADSVQIATMGTVRYDYMINDRLPGFSSIWLAGFWENYTDDALAIAELNNLDIVDNYRFEASVASFVYPTGSQRFRVGVELAYVGSQIAEEDGFGAFLQMVYSLTEPHTNRFDPIRVGSLGDISPIETGSESEAPSEDDAPDADDQSAPAGRCNS